MKFKPHQQATEEKKKAILEFYNKHSRFPKERSEDPEEHRLGYTLNHYISKSQAVYDPQFDLLVRSMGRERGDISRNCKIVLKFCAEHGRLPTAFNGTYEAELRQILCRLRRVAPDFAEEISQYPEFIKPVKHRLAYLPQPLPVNARREWSNKLWPKRRKPDRSIKLTPEQVIAIRTVDRAAGLGCRKAAKKYGVHHSTIKKIRSNKIWKNVP